MSASLKIQNRVNALAKKGDWTGAIASYEAALPIRENYDKPPNNLGVGLEIIGTRDEELQQFSEAVGMNGNYAQAQYNLGRLLGRFGRRDKAILPLTEALRLQLNYPEARQQLRQPGVPHPR